MDKYFLNVELSKSLSKRGQFKKQKCYDNIFDNLGAIGSVFLEEDVRVMFCYLQVIEKSNLYCRHACLVLNGEVIDPTLATTFGERLVKNKENEYIPFKIMTVDEYLRLLKIEKRTDLCNTFRGIESIKQRELQKHGIVTID